MKVELKNEFQTITITDEHSASSYGVPVAIFNGDAYGPKDNMRTIPADDVLAYLNDHNMAENTVAGMLMESKRDGTISDADAEFVRKFLA